MDESREPYGGLVNGRAKLLPVKLAGGYVGARMHARIPETIIRRLLALVVIAIGIRYPVGGLTGGA